MRNVIFPLVGLALLSFAFSLFVVHHDVFKKHLELQPILKINELSYYIEPDHVVIQNYNALAFSSKSSKKPITRLISIGDVHGSYDELQKLLNKLHYDPRVDQLLFLGDFISKGTQNFEVLDFAIKNKVQCVLGNHEISILKKYTRYYNREAPKVCSSIEDAECINKEVLDNNLKLKLRHDLELSIAKQLDQSHIEYLTSCSIMLELGPIGYGFNQAENNDAENEQKTVDNPVEVVTSHQKILSRKKKDNYNYSTPINGIAVHAGIQWNLDLVDQKVNVLTNIRALFKPEYTEACFDRKSEIDDSMTEPWSKIWNEKQHEIADWTKRRMVLYGHEAARGLVEREYSMGLDTGCVNGGKLTALVVTAAKSKKNRIQYRNEIVQISC